MLIVVAVALAQDEPIDVIAQVEADTSAGVITLTFDDRQPTSKTLIYRRAPSIGEAWRGTDLVATLSSGEPSWTDPDALPGEVWEYNIERFPADKTPREVQGMITAALDAPLVDDRGRCVLVVDATIAAPLAGKIDRLVGDLVGDGYTVVRVDVDRTDAPPAVKAAIVDAAADAEGEVTVFLLGHVPVPYAGAMNPDGHLDHFGAWPADMYYAELDDTWTDTYVDTTLASRPANHNVPGDGKFDNTMMIVSDVDWMLGRVDMFDLPAFAPLDEVALLGRYLDKDHAWRHGSVTVETRALIDDNFGAYAPGAKSGWALAPLVGRANLAPGDWMTTLPTSSYLWAYGCGGGTFSSAGGVASTSDFAANPLQAVFTMIFGSYHGDWDSTDNLLRGVIAADGSTLTSAWAGRPNWWNHPMAVGESIGFAARWSMNNTDNTDYGGRWVHVALLGDPTLRMHPVLPPGAVTVTADEAEVTATWAPSAAPGLLGYHVYGATDPAGPYLRLTDAPVVEPAYTWSADGEGVIYVSVRAVAATRGFAGSYENASQAIFGEVDVVCTYEGCVEPEPVVDEAPGGCGCAGGGAPSTLWALAAAGVGLRRRRRA